MAATESIGMAPSEIGHRRARPPDVGTNPRCVVGSTSANTRRARVVDRLPLTGCRRHVLPPSWVAPVTLNSTNDRTRETTMKICAALILMSSVAASWAADPAAVPNGPAANVAPLTAGPASPTRPASAPNSSQAVQAAKNAEQPGKLRPENPVVPQLSVPLSGAKPGPSGGTALPPKGPANGKPDDRAAACAAHMTKAERDKCERSL